MVSNDLLLKGIAAAKEGDLERARAILSKVVLEEPDLEEAWWWLAKSVDDPHQREFCAKKILEINPRHRGARGLLQVPTKSSGQNGSLAAIALENQAAQTDTDAPSPRRSPFKRMSARQKGARTTRQTAILVLLALAVFLVFIGGASYVFLDTTGYLDQLFSVVAPRTSSATPPSPPAATATSEGFSLSSIPTWTPTPPPANSQALPTPEITLTTNPTMMPTPIPPTPSALPSTSNAQKISLYDGTGFLTLAPDSFTVLRFEPAEILDIQYTAMLTFHLLNAEPTYPLTFELYLWNESNNLWEPFGVSWGDNPITMPDSYVQNDGVIIAAIRNWGRESTDVDNAGFTFAGYTTDGREIYFGLGRADSRYPPTPVPTVTVEFG